MAFGFAIYGTQEITPSSALNEGIRFFETIKSDINAQGYYALRRDRSQEDIDFVEKSLDELKYALEKGEAKDFRIYHEGLKGTPWEAAFGYSTKTFGGFFHINLQYNGDGLEDLFLFLERFFENNAASYAIGYKCADVYDAYHYAIGENMVKLFSWENAMTFNKEVDGRFQGQARFNSTKLRLVYPVNVINSSHLDIMIGESTLCEAIQKNDWGILKKINSVNERWFWIVQDNQLESINNELGMHGVLISWKKFSPRRGSNRLP